MTAPKCKRCGKQLKKRIYAVMVKPGQSPPVEFHGKKVLEAVKRENHMGGTVDEYEIWRGEWGYNGDDFFCTLRCGYWWAVEQVRKLEAGT